MYLRKDVHFNPHRRGQLDRPSPLIAGRELKIVEIVVQIYVVSGSFRPSTQFCPLVGILMSCWLQMALCNFILSIIALNTSG